MKEGSCRSRKGRWVERYQSRKEGEGRKERKERRKVKDERKVDDRKVKEGSCRKKRK